MYYYNPNNNPQNPNSNNPYQQFQPQVNQNVESPSIIQISFNTEPSSQLIYDSFPVQQPLLFNQNQVQSNTTPYAPTYYQPTQTIQNPNFSNNSNQYISTIKKESSSKQAKNSFIDYFNKGIPNDLI
jgi:hypothetical protein